MTIQQLQYIVALDTHRHFVRAASSCHVTQPTLTLQVKKLEEQMGVQIFDRTTQPLTVTEMGEKVIQKARRVLREVNQLREMVNKDKNQMAGTFRLGVIPSLSPYLLPLFLRHFSQLHPHTRLEINELQSEAIIEGLDSDTLDIGLLVTPLHESSIREIKLFYEPFLLFAHPLHPLLGRELVSPQDLTEDDLWVMSQGHCFRDQILNLCQMAAQNPSGKNIRFEGGSIETLKNMIRNISGYTLIPEMAYEPRQESSQVRRFEAPEPAREVSLVVHNSFTKELLLQELKASVLAVTPDHMRKNTSFVAVNWR